MPLDVVRLVFDFGLVVLIWMVQTIIYPGFLYYTPADLLKWHAGYTKRITCLVIPLMVGQLALGLWEAYSSPSLYTLGSLSLIVGVWLITFSFFVPQHQKIAKGMATEALLRSLITKNWLRTGIWTLIFVWTFLEKYASTL
jgi:hypothetical protein